MICTGANTEVNIRKVLEYASKIISNYVIEITPPTKPGEGKKPIDPKKPADAK